MKRESMHDTLPLRVMEHVVERLVSGEFATLETILAEIDDDTVAMVVARLGMSGVLDAQVFGGGEFLFLTVDGWRLYHGARNGPLL